MALIEQDAVLWTEQQQLGPKNRMIAIKEMLKSIANFNINLRDSLGCSLLEEHPLTYSTSEERRARFFRERAHTMVQTQKPQMHELKA